MRCACVAVLTLLLLLSRSASAQHDSYARIAVGGTVAPGMSFGNHCPGAIDDTYECSAASMFLGFRLSPRWRGGAHWALGVNGGVAAVKALEKNSTWWWDGQAEARLYPLGPRDGELWLAGTAGAVAASDSVPAHRIDTGVLHPAKNYSVVGPIAGLGAGYDLAQGRHVALGAELRGFVIAFGGRATGLDPHYGTQGGFWIGLTVTGMGHYR